MYNSVMNENIAIASPSSDTTIFSLLHAAHALEDKVERALEKAELSGPKYSVLSALVTTGGPVSLSELANRLSCVRSNMTQLVDRLEADGLVRRVDDPNDRRAVKASITDEGRRRQAAGAAEVEKLHQEFSANVDDDDRAALGRMLSALK
jgi:DNA-binding MarR family transcriptional regulator